MLFTPIFLHLGPLPLGVIIGFVAASLYSATVHLRTKDYRHLWTDILILGIVLSMPAVVILVLISAINQ